MKVKNVSEYTTKQSLSIFNCLQIYFKKKRKLCKIELILTWA